MKTTKQIKNVMASGTTVEILHKKTGNKTVIEVESSLLNDEAAYNSPRSYVTQALVQLFKTDLNPTINKSA